jgi:hypothetical protein
MDTGMGVVSYVHVLERPRGLTEDSGEDFYSDAGDCSEQRMYEFILVRGTKYRAGCKKVVQLLFEVIPEDIVQRCLYSVIRTVEVRGLNCSDRLATDWYEVSLDHHERVLNPELGVEEQEVAISMREVLKEEPLWVAAVGALRTVEQQQIATLLITSTISTEGRRDNKPLGRPVGRLIRNVCTKVQSTWV